MRAPRTADGDDRPRAPEPLEHLAVARTHVLPHVIKEQAVLHLGLWAPGAAFGVCMHWNGAGSRVRGARPCAHGRVRARPRRWQLWCHAKGLLYKSLACALAATPRPAPRPPVGGRRARCTAAPAHGALRTCSVWPSSHAGGEPGMWRSLMRWGMAKPSMMICARARCTCACRRQLRAKRHAQRTPCPGGWTAPGYPRAMPATYRNNEGRAAQ